MTDTLDSFLGGGGSPSAKFIDVGATVKGTVTAAEVVQQTEFGTGTPKTWDDGKPMMQAVITLSTDLRDDDIEDDDGTRRLFVKGQMQKAVREALKAAGVKSLEIGGTLAVKYTGDGAPSKPGFNGPKLYAAQYKAAPVSAGLSADELL